MAEFVEHAARQPRYGQWMSEAQESAVAEVGLMLGVAQRTAAARVDTALDLVERLSAVHRALSRGRLNLAAARAIAEESATLDGPAAAAVAATVLAGSAQRTPGQLRAATRRAVADIDPAALQRRHEEAVRQRGVWLHDEPDGMALLSARLPADAAVVAYSAIDRLAAHGTRRGDEQGTDAADQSRSAD